jgi:hypothetical protein
MPLRGHKRAVFAAVVAFVAAALGLGACGGGSNSGSGAKTTGTKTTEAAVKCKPASGSKVTLRSHWAAGDRKAIVITKTQNGKSSSTTADVQVVASNASGSRLRFTTEPDTTLPSSSAAEKAALENLLKKVGKMSVAYTTDADGAFKAVENRSEMRAYLRRTADALEQLATTPDEKKAFEQTRALITSDAYIETAISDTVGVLHSGYGLEASRDKPTSFATALPNSLGGDPIKAKAQAKLVTIRDPAGCAEVQMDVTTTEDDLAKALLPAMTKLAPAGSKKPTRADIAGLGLSETYRFTYDPGSGWMTHVEFTNRTTSSSETKIQKTALDLR